MPVYEYICDGCGREREELVPMGRAKVPKCLCNKRMRRKMSEFAARSPSSANNPRMMERERKGWQLATGRKIESAGDLERYCKETGKYIVEPGFKPKKPEDYPDWQIEKDIQKHREDRFGIKVSAKSLAWKKSAKAKRKKA